MTTSAPARLATFDEVAEALRVNRRTVQRLAATGAIRVVRVGRCARVPVDEIDRLIREGTTPTGRERQKR